MKFSELSFDQQLQQAIDKLGYADATPIQEAAMPVILSARDVFGLAQTGTGKTAAFLLPLMDRILKSRASTEGLSDEGLKTLEERKFPDWRRQNFILILVPTRELAEQVFDNIQKLSEFSGIRGVSVYGGTGYEKQKEGFRQAVEFVVATPGRLIDLYKEHVVDLKQVRAVVFDEADRMFDMGFKEDMKYILQRVPKERQILLFSATLNYDVLNVAYQFGANPVEINVSRDQAKAENVRDEIFHLGQEDKPKYLYSLLKKHNPKQVIVFSNFKHNVERIAQFLSANSFPAMAISSLLTQAQRNRVIELFKAENEKNILVATDVAARGLDIKGVDMVINFELPNDAESYVHRIGRTGRAGQTGQAISLVSDRDVEALQRIEEFLKHKLTIGWLEESEITKESLVYPSEERSHGHHERGDRPQRGDRNNRSGGRGPRDERRPRSEGGGSRNRHEGRSEVRGEHRRDQARPDRPYRENSERREAHDQRREPRDSREQGTQKGRSHSRPHRGGQESHQNGAKQGGKSRQHAQGHSHNGQGKQRSHSEKGRTFKGHAKSQNTPRAQVANKTSLVKKVKGIISKLFR